MGEPARKWSEFSGEAPRRKEQAYLRLVPNFRSLRDALPQHLVEVLDGLTKEMEERAFQPISQASSLTEAEERFDDAFDAFRSLWPSVIGALMPWLAEDPAHGKLAQAEVEDHIHATTTNEYLSDEVNDNAVAALNARITLAAVLIGAGDQPPAELIEAVQDPLVAFGALIADFCLCLLRHLRETQKERTLPEVALWLSQIALESARDIYGIVVAYRFKDANDLDDAREPDAGTLDE